MCSQTTAFAWRGRSWKEAILRWRRSHCPRTPRTHTSSPALPKQIITSRSWKLPIKPRALTGGLCEITGYATGAMHPTNKHLAHTDLCRRHGYHVYNLKTCGQTLASLSCGVVVTGDRSISQVRRSSPSLRKTRSDLDCRSRSRERQIKRRPRNKHKQTDVLEWGRWKSARNSRGITTCAAKFRGHRAGLAGGEVAQDLRHQSGPRYSRAESHHVGRSVGSHSAIR